MGVMAIRFNIYPSHLLWEKGLLNAAHIHSVILNAAQLILSF